MRRGNKKGGSHERSEETHEIGIGEHKQIAFVITTLQELLKVSSSHGVEGASFLQLQDFEIRPETELVRMYVCMYTYLQL